MLSDLLSNPSRFPIDRRPSPTPSSTNSEKCKRRKIVFSGSESTILAPYFTYPSVVLNNSDRILAVSLWTAFKSTPYGSIFGGSVSKETIAYKIPEVARKLSVSRSTVYRLLDSGELEYITIRNVRRVRQIALARYLDKLQREHREKSVRLR